jgi:hypothetical protein
VLSFLSLLLGDTRIGLPLHPNPKYPPSTEHQLHSITKNCAFLREAGALQAVFESLKGASGRWTLLRYWSGLVALLVAELRKTAVLYKTATIYPTVEAYSLFLPPNDKNISRRPTARLCYICLSCILWSKFSVATKNGATSSVRPHSRKQSGLDVELQGLNSDA